MEEIKVLNGAGSVQLVAVHGSESLIVKAARVSYASDYKVDTDLSEADKRILKTLIEKNHTTPLEHIIFTFKITCPIFVRSQWHRHRTWSYSELSRRFTSKNIDVYIPHNIKFKDTDAAVNDKNKAIKIFEAASKNALGAYDELLKLGVYPEQARLVLPMNLMTVFYATVDLNNLLKFIELREATDAQPEIVEYAKALKSFIEDKLPVFMSIYNACKK